MLDIGWSEMAVIALVALIVIGPKELPQAMRAASKWIRKARSLAREFQSGVDDMIREADLEDARKAVESAKNLDFDKAFEETVDPGGEVRSEASGLGRAARPDGTDTEKPDRTGNEEQPTEPGEHATVIEHPLKIAPAHSIAPPTEEPAADKATADGKSKTA